MTTTERVLAAPGDTGSQSRMWSESALAFALVVGGGMPALVSFGSAYGGNDYLVIGFVGLLVASLLVHFGVRFRQPTVLIAAELVVVYLLVGSVLVIHTSGSSRLPGSANLATMARMTFSGWNSLLSTSPVVGDTGNLLVIPFLCAMAAAALSMGLARRARTAWLAVVPIIALLAVGILFGTNANPSELEPAGLLALVILSWLAYRARSQRVHGIGSASRRLPWRAASLVVVACVIGVLAAPSLPGSSAHVRYVLRDHVDIPFNPLDYPSPLSAYRLYVLPKSQGGMKTTQLFKVSGAPAGSLLRIATLDQYNGVVMNVAGGAPGSAASGNFSTVGSPVSPNLCYSKAPCRTATVTITDLHYSNVWLPDIGMMRSIQFEGNQGDTQRSSFRYNDATDNAVLTSELEPGDRYSMSVDVPKVPSSGSLQEAQPAQVELPAPANVPSAVHQQALALTAGATTSFAKAEALQSKLTTLGAYSDGTATDPPSLPGHGAFRIQQFLSLPQPVGDAEQYAVAMDLMALNLGLPARVVLGARLQPGTSTVTGADITAWVEVKFVGVGWYPYFPTPRTDAKVRAVPPPPSSSSSNQAQNPNPPAPNDGNGSVDSNAQTKTLHHKSPTPRALQLLQNVLKVTGVLVLVLLVVLGPFVAIVWAKARRRKRRRTSWRPADRVTGGWQEVIDHALDRGTTVPSVATRNEQAVVVGPSTVAIAQRADQDTFGPTEPDDGEAAAFWELIDHSLSEIDQSMGTWDRLKVKVNPRSLVAAGGASGGGSLRRLIGRTGSVLRDGIVSRARARRGRKAGDV